ncbi:uncharacterized protein PHALS_13196 [Plasmopara halstedii]|uniref:RxLR-like protein n=1 Tax=Plasmopara halstedii TaxID=4781 RepID=A0A0N7L609_PLAHL|nr:uncharacterized protein PHALS_13196 [Plasmopara halstedii]CEG42963.1 hypothetical protein PHALS_13196 [Plasmopara halstedii]|eukprot:XP_024579332.1 hypothetical protein PHALS_13196 [Plasmopara halstedii]
MLQSFLLLSIIVTTLVQAGYTLENSDIEERTRTFSDLSTSDAVTVDPSAAQVVPIHQNNDSGAGRDNPKMIMRYPDIRDNQHLRSHNEHEEREDDVWGPIFQVIGIMTVALLFLHVFCICLC